MKLESCETLPKSGIVMLSYYDCREIGMIARWLSIILHPFVMVGVMVGPPPPRDRRRPRRCGASRSCCSRSFP